MQTNYEKTMENFREYLKSSNHNIVGENFNTTSSSGFICESLISTKRMIIKIQVDQPIEYAFVSVYAGISIPKPYRTMAMEYCMRENNKKKISYIAIDDKLGDVYVHIESSFKDAPLSGDTLKDMEGIAISTFLHSYDDLQQIARGVLMDDSVENNKRDLFSRLCDDMDLSDSDDEDEYDMNNHIDIVSMLKQLESEAEADSDEESA